MHVGKDLRIRGYFQELKGVHGQKSLGNTDLEENLCDIGNEDYG